MTEGAAASRDETTVCTCGWRWSEGPCLADPDGDSAGRWVPGKATNECTTIEE